MSATLLPVRRERIIHTPYVILALLQVLDVLTTWIILTAWSARAEGNPVAGTILDNFGINFGLLVLLALKLGVVALFWDCQTKVRLVTAIYGLVLVNNFVFLGLWLHSAVMS